MIRSCGVVLVAILLVGCALELVPTYDPEPIPFPAGLYERYSAGRPTEFGTVDDRSLPGPLITHEQAVRRATAEVEPVPPEEIIGLMRRAKLDRQGEVTHTAWLVAFSSGPIVAIDDQTGEVITVVDGLPGS